MKDYLELLKQNLPRVKPLMHSGQKIQEHSIVFLLQTKKYMSVYMKAQALVIIMSFYSQRYMLQSIKKKIHTLPLHTNTV